VSSAGGTLHDTSVPVRTKLLAVGNAVLAGAQTVYTCPVDRTAILKDIRVVSYGAGSPQLEIIMSALSGHQVRIWRGPLTQYVPEGAACWVVIPENCSILVNISLAGDVNYWMSGTELLGETDIPTVPTFREVLQNDTKSTETSRERA
jgi:hypothetical protein